MNDLQYCLDKLGYEQFRPFQQEALDALMAKQDVLLIAPTGGGKSLVYQAIGLMSAGVTIVVSPLIALMEQQVAKLNKRSIAAAFIHGNLNPGEQADLIQSIRNQHIKLLYLSPEKLIQASTIGVLESIDVSLFAIDEAHCIVQWGGHFRPEYQQLGKLKERFPKVPVIALTGTVGKQAITSIKESLSIESSVTISDGFNRENIRLKVAQKHKAKQQLLHFLHYDVPGQSGIVYCRSRAKTEQMAVWLEELGFHSCCYHAGMTESERAQSHREFETQTGRIMFATTAYGMGLDIKHVHFVVHLDLPSSPESYWQEVGRAGRGKTKAQSLLLYGLQDVLKLIQFHQRQSYKSHTETKALYEFLQIIESRGCRKKNLLEHFNESIAECGECDRCLTKSSEYNATVASQKLLSLIYYTKGLAPISALIQVLLGKDTKAVKAIQGQKLSLFNKGRELTQVQWKSIARYLIAFQYLEVQMEPKTIFFLNDKSRLLLQGKDQVLLSQDGFYPYLEESQIDNDALIWHQLMGWKQDNPELVMSDKQLKNIFQHKPNSIASLSRLTGLAQSAIAPFWTQLESIIVRAVTNNESR
ncbi:RecQ family ATP-dependent DNA helicase [Marinomonas epiphytica]